MTDNKSYYSEHLRQQKILFVLVVSWAVLSTINLIGYIILFLLKAGIL